jgi:hypothetical protein
MSYKYKPEKSKQDMSADLSFLGFPQMVLCTAVSHNIPRYDSGVWMAESKNSRSRALLFMLWPNTRVMCKLYVMISWLTGS